METQQLTDAELRIMKIIWESGSATVKEVIELLPPEDDLAYTTVLTTLQILEKKGIVGHEKRGRAYLYYPLLRKREATRHAVDEVIGRFFDGSAKELMLNIIDNDEIDEAELAEMKKLIERRAQS